MKNAIDYFDNNQSMQQRARDDVARVLETIACRYIGRHPAHPFVFRAFGNEGFKQLDDGRYDLNLGEKLPEARLGQYAYAFGMLYREEAGSVELSLSCYGPSRIYANGSLLYASDVEEDVNVRRRKTITAALQRGWNGFFIKLRNTASGFGCRFGSNYTKWAPLDFMSPFAERNGQAGWIYSGLTDRDIYKDEPLPGVDAMEHSTGLAWYPRQAWSEEEQKLGNCERIFGQMPGTIAYGWTKLHSAAPGEQICKLSGRTMGPIRIWVDRDLVYESSSAEDALATEFPISCGSRQLLVESTAGPQEWGYELIVSADRAACAYMLPHPVRGAKDPWLYLGPFEERQVDAPAPLQSMYGWFASGGNGVYWQLDRPATRIRPYLENPLFGKWNYPLGVTLYGLLQTGRLLHRYDLIDYVTAHIRECTQMYRYSLWDREQYGYPSINQQLVELDMLDDCGSFGSAMLEAYSDHPEPTFLEVAHSAADYMKHRQERRSDGAFYRDKQGTFNENTMWADDLYMSTPFLIRYFKLTGDSSVLDDAVNQFIQFKKRLFMPELQLMSHVYDFKYETATYVPWGRGNGWPVFSLSEVLETLDSQAEKHPLRDDLLNFFNELCEGLLRVQGARGLWHQVLTDPASYEETSCTAMFLYAFSRGVRMGWLRHPDRYIQAVETGWSGLTRCAIDQQGNIFGVCRGSRYSFTADYYKDELMPMLNDTHGIGIVLLAGIEVTKLREALR